MQKEFIPHQESLDMKELGFNDTHYILCIDTPDGREYTKIGQYPILYQQAFRWFREKYKLDCSIELDSVRYGSSIKDGYYEKKSYKYCITKSFNSPFRIVDENFKTYEEAELECLKKLIEIVKKQK